MMNTSNNIDYLTIDHHHNNANTRYIQRAAAESSAASSQLSDPPLDYLPSHLTQRPHTINQKKRGGSVVADWSKTMSSQVSPRRIDMAK